MRTLAIYFDLGKRAFILNLAYRAQLVLWFVLDLIPLAVMMLVWVSVFSGNPELRGYQLGQVIEYYFLVMVLTALTSQHFEQYRVRQIREGKIDYYLTRPLSYPAEIGITAFGTKLFYAMIALTLAVSSWFVFQYFFPLELALPSIGQLSQVVILLIGAYLIEYYLALIIVLLGFWFDHAEGLEHFKWISLSLLSGYMMPVAFMPDWLRRLTELLPFKYVAAVPIGIMQQTTSFGWTDFVYLTGFIAILAGISHFIWQKAQYHYSSAGG